MHRPRAWFKATYHCSQYHSSPSIGLDRASAVSAAAPLLEDDEDDEVDVVAAPLSFSFHTSALLYRFFSSTSLGIDICPRYADFN